MAQLGYSTCLKWDMIGGLPARRGRDGKGILRTTYLKDVIAGKPGAVNIDGNVLDCTRGNIEVPKAKKKKAAPKKKATAKKAPAKKRAPKKDAK